MSSPKQAPLLGAGAPQKHPGEPTVPLQKVREESGQQEDAQQSWEVEEAVFTADTASRISHHSHRSDIEDQWARRRVLLRLLVYLSVHYLGFGLNITVMILFQVYKQTFFFAGLVAVFCTSGGFCAYAALMEEPRLHNDMPKILRIPFIVVIYGFLQWIQVHHIFDLYRRRVEKLVAISVEDGSVTTMERDSSKCLADCHSASMRVKQEKIIVLEKLAHVRTLAQTPMTGSTCGKELADQVGKAQASMKALQRSLGELSSSVSQARARNVLTSDQLTPALNASVVQAVELIDPYHLRKASPTDLAAIAENVASAAVWATIDEQTQRLQCADGEVAESTSGRPLATTPVTTFHSKTFEGIIEGLFFGGMSYYAFFLLDVSPPDPKHNPLELCQWHMLTGKGDFLGRQDLKWVFLSCGMLSTISLALGAVEVDYRVNAKVRDRVENTFYGAFVQTAFRVSEIVHCISTFVIICLLIRPLLPEDPVYSMMIVIPQFVLWVIYVGVYTAAKPADSPWESSIAHVCMGFATVAVNVAHFVEKPGYISMVRRVNRSVIFVRICLQLFTLGLGAAVAFSGHPLCDSKTKTVWEHIFREQKIAIVFFLGSGIIHGLLFSCDNGIRSALALMDSSRVVEDEAVIEMVPDQDSRHPEAATTRRGASRGLSSYLLTAALGLTSRLFIQDEEQLGDFTIERELGKGEYSVVVLVRQRNRGGEALPQDRQRLYAMKMQNTGGRRGGENIATKATMAERERDLLRSLQHPFIVRLVFYFEMSDKSYKDTSKGEVVRDVHGNDRFHKAIVMEYCSQGDLQDYVVERAHPVGYQPSSFDGSALAQGDIEWLVRMRRFCAEIIVALSFLHGRRITFRDLKPQNVLLKAGGDSELHICLTDFGFARQTSEGNDDSQLVSIAGTATYASPEMIEIWQGQSRATYTSAVDLFSLGRTLLVMLWRTKYMEDPPDLRVPQAEDFRGDLRVPDVAENFITKMTSRDPKARGESRDLHEHPFFHEFEHCGTAIGAVDWTVLESNAA